MAVTKCDLEAFIKSTLLYSETNFEIKYFARDSSTERGRKTRIKHTPTNDTGDPIEECMIFLEEYEFIRLQFNEETQEMSYIATRLGHACLGNKNLLALFMPCQHSYRNYAYFQRKLRRYRPARDFCCSPSCKRHASALSWNLNCTPYIWLHHFRYAISCKRSIGCPTWTCGRSCRAPCDKLALWSA